MAKEEIEAKSPEDNTLLITFSNIIKGSEDYSKLLQLGLVNNNDEEDS